MDASMPVAVPPPFKSRRGWLIVFGIIEILIGCSFLLMILLSAFAFFGPTAARMPPNAMAAGPFSRTGLMVLVGAQYGFMAAIFFTGGMGSILGKNWARIYMLVVSGLWLTFGVMTTLVMVFLVPTIMRQQTAKVPATIQHAVVVGMIAFTVSLGVVLPAIFLFFYSRKSVKDTCRRQNVVDVPSTAAMKAPGLPVLLAILGGWEALSALSVLAIVFVRVTLVFGVVVHGAAAVLIILVHAVLSGYAGWLFFRRDLLGWKIALAKNGFWLVSALVTLFRQPDVTPLFREMGYNQPAFSIYERFPQMMPLT
jgi:hypothetical protein